MRINSRYGAAVGSLAAAFAMLGPVGGSSGTSAGAAITPPGGHQLVAFPGTSGPPSALPTAMPSGMARMPSTASAGARAAKPVAAVAVTIRNFAFGPKTVSIKVGTTVHWTNRDAEAHTVTSDTGAFKSPVLPPGASYSFRFTKSGTYTYHCSIHPFMTGKVVVAGRRSSHR